MASNFEVSVDKKSKGFDLKLVGDFDATSAYELIYAIKKLPNGELAWFQQDAVRNVNSPFLALL